MNKKWIVLCGAVTFLSIIIWQGANLFKRMQSKKLTTVVVRKSIYNFGKVRPGDTAIAKFTIVNNGEENFFIKDVDPECHCTVAQWNKNAVAPLDSTVIIAKVTENAEVGYIRKLITVTSNIQKSPMILIVEGAFRQ